MNVKEAFTSRRSVRRFLPKTVPIEKINNILECATFAPSGHNIQPWHVYVVQGKKKESITNSILESIKDGSANVGILVNYVFNDGGRLDAQISGLKEKIKEVKSQRQTIEKDLESQLNVAIETYIGTQKTYDTALELVNLSKEVRDTSKDQLVSGRSKIQEVLNAEVTLAENKIQLVNAEVELKLASYRIRALTHGLTKETGWKPLY